MPAVFTALAFGTSSCRDAGGVVQTGNQAVPRSITPRAAVTTSGNTAIVTLELDVHGAVGRIGSFTGRLHFDPAGLSYEGDTPWATLLAVNAGTGEIRVAGASPDGVDVTRLAELRFTVRNPTALQTLQFDLDEVHEVSRADVQATLRRGAGPRIIR